MLGSDSSPREFREGWERDYFEELSDDEVRATIEEDWARDALLMDYQEAGRDSRNRDRLLHNSFYVGLVLFGLVLNGGIRLFINGELNLAFPLMFIGGILFIVLSFWSLKAKTGRDASFDRRSEIEDLYKIVSPALLRSNDSCFKRLNRIGDGNYEVNGLRKIENLSAGNLIIGIQLSIAGVLFLLALAAFVFS